MKARRRLAVVVVVLGIATGVAYGFWFRMTVPAEFLDPSLVFVFAGLALALWLWGGRQAAVAPAADTVDTKFIKRLHHQLVQPVQTIGSALDNLSTVQPEDQPRIDHINAAAERLFELAHALDDIYQLERQKVKGETIQLPVLLDAEAADLERMLSRTIQKRHPIAPLVLPPVAGNRALLRQAFRNLLHNALKYSESGSPVLMETEERNGQVVVIIRDRGIGIPQADLPVITQYFARGSNVGARTGSGVGLALAQQIIALHGGTLEPESSENEGTTVTVRLPRLRT